MDKQVGKKKKNQRNGSLATKRNTLTEKIKPT